MKKVIDERATGKYCKRDRLDVLKSNIWRNLKDCNLLDEFDKKKCETGFFPKRTCLVNKIRTGDLNLKREFFPIDEEFKKKSKKDEDFKRCLE